MPSSEPLVTVGMAVYNGAEFLTKSLRSIVAGSYPNIELLVVDDGSTDKSIDIVKRVDDSRIRIIHNKLNNGLVRTRQQIMQEARGTYLAWLDQDDVAYPNRIARQVALLEANQAVGACGSWTIHRVHDASGKESLRKSSAPGRHEEIHASMPFVNPISFNTATMRVSAFLQNDLSFREKYGNTLDYDLWSRAADVMELRNIQEYLGEYRIHSSQTSRGPSSNRMLEAAWSVQREVLERNLGLQLDSDFGHIHSRAMLTPQLLTSETDAVEAGNWIRFLSELNKDVGTYQQKAFDNALSRQWVYCLLHVSRAIGFSKGVKLAAASRSITGFRNHNLLYGVRAALPYQVTAMVQKLMSGG
ncbi:glycosyltransferase [bacterium]|nr:glycosyltransferase [bacterium]